MKKYILMFAFLVPFALSAQTKNTKKTPKSNKQTVVLHSLLMTYQSKGEDRDKYVFECSDPAFNRKLSEVSKDFKSEVQAIAILQRKGWHLVAVDGNRYFFNQRPIRK